MINKQENTIKKEIVSLKDIERRYNFGKETVGIVPDFFINLRVSNITFIIREKDWVKCIIGFIYKDWRGNDTRDTARGMSHLHPDDMWDERTGKEIAFSKAMADMFQLNHKRLFNNGSDE